MDYVEPITVVDMLIPSVSHLSWEALTQREKVVGVQCFIAEHGNKT